MQRKYTYLLILLISVVIGIIHGVVITPSPNLFFSWLLVGIWICFTLHLFHKLNLHRQYNSPHNTSFFILGPISIGILMAFWGYFTELLDRNLFEYFGPSPIYLSLWTLIFASPYLGYGLYSLYSCFRRYDVVYLGEKSVSARAFGFFITTLMIFLGICSLLIFIIVTAIGPIPFAIRVPTVPDFFLILTSVLAVFVLIRYGIFGRRPTVSEITARTRREEIYRPPSRPRSTTRTTSRSTRRSDSSSPRTRTSTRTTTRSQPQTQPAARSPRRTRSAQPSSPKEEKVTKPKLQKLIKYIKPKAGHLTREDFKCIFCFNLPSYPADKGRGIVVCPKCKHPAHADEFREWLENSSLCSRCDSLLPAQFRRNPQIIPVKTYLAVMKALAKK